MKRGILIFTILQKKALGESWILSSLRMEFSMRFSFGMSWILEKASLSAQLQHIAKEAAAFDPVCNTLPGRSRSKRTRSSHFAAATTPFGKPPAEAAEHFSCHSLRFDIEQAEYLHLTKADPSFPHGIFPLLRASSFHEAYFRAIQRTFRKLKDRGLPASISCANFLRQF